MLFSILFSFYLCTKVSFVISGYHKRSDSKDWGHYAFVLDVLSPPPTCLYWQVIYECKNPWGDLYLSFWGPLDNISYWHQPFNISFRLHPCWLILLKKKEKRKNNGTAVLKGLQFNSSSIFFHSSFFILLAPYCCDHFQHLMRPLLPSPLTTWKTHG